MQMVHRKDTGHSVAAPA